MVRVARLAALLPLLLLAACGGVPSTIAISPTTAYTLTVTPQTTTIPVNGTVTFTATSNAPASSILWSLYSFAYANAGSPTTQFGGTTFTYTAPPTPPVYSLGTPTPGIVTILVSAGTTQVQQSFTITAPSITTGISSFASTLALGATDTINAYAVGSVNNALTLQVNGVTGGSTSVGTIAATGGIYGQYLYTAPAILPMTGTTVTLTVISQADPTKTSSTTITLH